MFAWLAALGLREAYRRRGDADPTTRFLAIATLGPAILLAAFTLFSRQAEPHWMGPAWLGVTIFVGHEHGRSDVASPRLVSAGISIAALLSVAVHEWVLSPRFLRFAPASYEPRYDIANELYGWPRAIEAVREVLSF